MDREPSLLVRGSRVLRRTKTLAHERHRLHDVRWVVSCQEVCAKSPQMREIFLKSDFRSTTPEQRWNPLVRDDPPCIPPPPSKPASPTADPPLHHLLRCGTRFPTTIRVELNMDLSDIRDGDLAYAYTEV